MIKPLIWENDTLRLIDQRKLPLTEEYVDINNLEECFDSIKDMIVRGAPLIGFTALWGMVLDIKNNPSYGIDQIIKSAEYLKSARPTAVNLAYEVERAVELAKTSLDTYEQRLRIFAQDQMDLLYENNLAMAKIAQKDLEKRFGDKKLRLMTLCNTGALACGPMGTALGVISHLASQGKIEMVYASETRPYLQGGRLTAYELCKEDIPHKITVEGAFSYILENKLVDAIFIGADRIVRNGDTANKIGSSTLAIVAKYYGVPFYVVAPTSSFDLDSKTGDEIEIELRPEDEVLNALSSRIAPGQSKALNPSFDVTRAKNITGIICEKGLIQDPISTESLLKVVES
ncbi:MAG: methylthioribose-1-phosphate isomerase [Bacteriovoracaceae bacterium]|jgi:methylthioribose-1-phosphate isomerase